MIESERDLLVRELQELYAIEQDLEELQSALADEATDEDVEEFFMSHGEATTDQLARLEEIFTAIDADADRRESPVLDGIEQRRDAVTDDIDDPNLADRVTAEAAREMERLEITKLETILTLTDRLDAPDEIVDRLETTRTESEDALERARQISAA